MAKFKKQGLFSRQEWVSRRPVEGSVERTVCGASEAVSEILPWGPECKPKLLVGSCKFFKSSKRTGTSFLQLTGRRTEKTFISSKLGKLVQKQTGWRGQNWWESSNSWEVSVLPRTSLQGGAMHLHRMLPWSGSTSLAWMGGWIQGLPSGRSAGYLIHPGPFTRVTFFSDNDDQ